MHLKKRRMIRYMHHLVKINLSDLTLDEFVECYIIRPSCSESNICIPDMNHSIIGCQHGTTNITENYMCSICRNILGGYILELECNHKFHVNCLSQLLKNSGIFCPICRNVITDSDKILIYCYEDRINNNDCMMYGHIIGDTIPSARTIKEFHVQILDPVTDHPCLIIGDNNWVTLQIGKTLYGIGNYGYFTCPSNITIDTAQLIIYNVIACVDHIKLCIKNKENRLVMIDAINIGSTSVSCTWNMKKFGLN